MNPENNNSVELNNNPELDKKDIENTNNLFGNLNKEQTGKILISISSNIIKDPNIKNNPDLLKKILKLSLNT